MNGFSSVLRKALQSRLHRPSLQRVQVTNGGEEVLTIQGVTFSHLLNDAHYDSPSIPSQSLRETIQRQKHLVRRQNLTANKLQRQSRSARRVIEEPLNALRSIAGLEFPTAPQEVFSALKRRQHRSMFQQKKEPKMKRKTSANNLHTSDEELEDDLILPVLSYQNRRQHTSAMETQEFRSTPCETWDALSTEERKWCRQAAQKNRLMVEMLREELAHGTLPMQLEQIQSFAEVHGVGFVDHMLPFSQQRAKKVSASVKSG